MTSLKTIATFQISYLQYLNEQHESVQPFPAFATSNFLLNVYKRMTLLRVFDTQMVNLHRTGKIGTFPSSQGQEALFVAIGLAMAKEDVLCSFYRDHGTLIQRAYALTDILAYWAGDERGNLSNPNNHDFPICIPIAGQCLHATGVAYAINYRHEKKAVVTSVGDGGTSKGDFYEAMNLAGAWQLPVVFVIDNNRLADHTTVDDASRYSDAEEKKAAWKKEPIARLGFYLESKQLWNRDKEAALQHECKIIVEKAFQDYFARDKQKPTSMFDYLFEQLPNADIDQYNELL